MARGAQMFKQVFLLLSGIFLSRVAVSTAPLSAQEPTSAAAPIQPLPAAQGTPSAVAPASQNQQVIVPVGTRLPLVLRNGINTRTAKAGDSIYFETIYPIAVNNRIVIPIGSFVRGQLLKSKRPGFVKGRGEVRMALDQMTFPNGYTLALTATPSSTDRDGQEGVDREGTIKGRSSSGRDVGLLLVATGGGAYIGTLAGALANGAPGTGALVGGGVGAAAAIIAILATRGLEAELPSGTTLDVVFNRPLILDVTLLPANEPGHLSSPMPSPRDAHPSVQREERQRRMKGSIVRSLVPMLHF